MGVLRAATGQAGQCSCWATSDPAQSGAPAAGSYRQCRRQCRAWMPDQMRHRSAAEYRLQGGGAGQQGKRAEPGRWQSVTVVVLCPALASRPADQALIAHVSHQGPFGLTHPSSCASRSPSSLQGRAHRPELPTPHNCRPSPKTCTSNASTDTPTCSTPTRSDARDRLSNVHIPPGLGGRLRL